ncbi:YeiH family protein [Paenibacillus sp. GCM10023252]|uniref:YeiH family protein n=1 Tax=Paenibacillus sp. GCM10023252 TaxID=3252649 RepID=UPI0036169049
MAIALHTVQKQPSTTISLVGGVTFTLIIALSGMLLAHLPVLRLLGPMAAAILLAVLYRQLFGYPEKLRSGITFSSRILLRTAIILFGLKLNIHILLAQGPSLLLKDAAVVLFAILTTVCLAKLFKADLPLSLLLGIGTGVCGAAAIAAVSPLLQSKEQDTAVGAGIIALVGTMFAVAYPLLLPILPFQDAADYGMWAGLTLHELAHAALAAAPAGEEALSYALMAKLGRVLMLVPVSFVVICTMRVRASRLSSGSTTGSGSNRIAFPWFLLGFAAMSVVGTYVIGPVTAVPDAAMSHISLLTTTLLTMAMVGLGLTVDLGQLRSRALRPLAAMVMTSVLLSVLGWLLV